MEIQGTKALFHLQYNKMVVVIRLKWDSVTLEVFSSLEDSEKCLVYAGVFLYPQLFQEEFCHSDHCVHFQMSVFGLALPITCC